MKAKTNLSFTDEELVSLAVALGARTESVGELWDDARQHAPDLADEYREEFERLGRLHRRVLTARRRLARKVQP